MDWQPILDLLPPSLVLSTVLTLLWATVWFVWQGGRWRDWLLDLLAALLGFGAGQLAGILLGLPLPAVGEVHVAEGTLLSWVALLVMRRRR